MISLPNLPVALLLQAALCLLVSAATNYTIDDQDPLFKYSGTWERNIINLNFTTGENMDKDGGHMLATPGSSATITYTFASVYFLACLWPYPVSTNYAIDGNIPLTIDMQDHSPTINTGANASVASNVLGQWTSNANQEHTIHITVPAGAEYSIVDMFIFEVLDPSDTSSTISSTSQTSSTRTTSVTASSSSSSSSSGAQGASSGTQGASSGSQGVLSTIERNLAISMGVVGTLLAVLFIFLLWWFCIRRKGRNGGNMDEITPQYHPVPTIPGLGTLVPLDDNSISVTSDGYYGPGIQNKNLYGPPITLSYDRSSSSYSDHPSTLYTNQSGSSSPPIQQVYHDPQRRISTLSMMTDRPPMYRPNPISDESAPVSSSSSNGNINEKRGRSPRIPPNIAGAEPEVGLTSAAIPGRGEENVRAWNSGYPQPLGFVPIV